MEKTKLGISENLLAAIIFFLASFSTLGAIIAIGYVLLAENSERLKNAAVRAILLIISFGVVSLIIKILNTAWDFLMNLIGIVKPLNWRFPLGLTGILFNILTVIEIVAFLAIGFAYLKGKNISLGPIDSVIEKN